MDREETEEGSKTLRGTDLHGSEFEGSESERMERIWKEMEGYWAPGSNGSRLLGELLRFR